MHDFCINAIPVSGLFRVVLVVGGGGGEVFHTGLHPLHSSRYMGLMVFIIQHTL